VQWEIDYVKDQGIVKVKTSGQKTRDDRKKLSEEMLAAGRKKKVNAFLLDQKETAFGLSVLEIDRLPAVLRDTGFSVKDRMAILINPDSPKSGSLRFLRSVLYLRSPRIQVFSDTEEATAWLKAKPRKHAKPAFEA
jgi:hypothetical protein